MYKNLRKIISAALVTAALATAGARDSVSIVEHVNNSVSVKVVLPDALARRMQPFSESAAEATAAEAPDQENAVIHRSGGYRVQIFSDNNTRTAKNEARSKAKSIAAAFPQYPTYVVYTSPYWRLKVGDFKSRDEAETAATQIKRAFPAYAREIRVVRDRINVKSL